ncbi:hypothetical protein AOLI_G00306360 [Acnodon oligacanthus]
MLPRPPINEVGATEPKGTAGKQSRRLAELDSGPLPQLRRTRRGNVPAGVSVVTSRVLFTADNEKGRPEDLDLTADDPDEHLAG